MHFKYHRLITEQALREYFDPKALRIIVKANLHKDDLISNIRQPEHHFTENKLGAALAYIETQREQMTAALLEGQDVSPAWRAFGRLLHTAQDFYAHSNYISLWVERWNGQPPPPEQVEAMVPELLGSARLHTVRSYRPVGSLGNIPGLGRWLGLLLPSDAHTRMNLDSPSGRPLFAYAFAAAVKRTVYEYRETERVIKTLGALDGFYRFTDQPGRQHD